MKEEKEEADSFHDFEKSEQLAIEISKLETYLYDKKHSFVEKNLDKQKRAVRAAINDAIGKLRKIHCDFALHLEKNIDYLFIISLTNIFYR